MVYKGSSNLSLLGANASIGVRDLDTENLGLLENVDTLLCANVVGNLGGVRAIVPDNAPLVSALSVTQLREMRN